MTTERNDGERPTYGTCDECGAELWDGWKYPADREPGDRSVRNCFDCGDGPVMPVGARDFDTPESRSIWPERVVLWSLAVLTLSSHVLGVYHPESSGPYQVFLSLILGIFLVVKAVDMELRNRNHFENNS